MPDLRITMEEASLLRDLLGTVRHGDSGLRTTGLAERLGKVDHALGKMLGCDRLVLYQDMLYAHRGYLIGPDGSLDLNGAEGVLAEYGETDLNLAEWVLADWRDRGLTR